MGSIVLGLWNKWMYCCEFTVYKFSGSQVYPEGMPSAQVHKFTGLSRRDAFGTSSQVYPEGDAFGTGLDCGRLPMN
jgi:hypothetical protein